MKAEHWIAIAFCLFFGSGIIAIISLMLLAVKPTLE